MGFPNILFLFKSVGPSHGKNDGLRQEQLMGMRRGVIHDNFLREQVIFCMGGGNFWPRRTVCEVNGRN